jgi:histidine triad (HIT) family protein
VIRADFDPKQMEEDRISAVQYLRFRLGPEQARRFSDPGVPARVRIDHTRYTQESPLPAEIRASLGETLAGGPAPLLPQRASTPADTDEILFETPRVRALRPARPTARAHVVVEPRDTAASLLDADPKLLAELLDAVRRVATTVVREHGHCRIQTDLGPETGRPRWHVFAPGR